jgi:hypothetical protein
MGRLPRSGSVSVTQQWTGGPGWVRMPRLLELLARISPAPAAALLLARGASSSAWAVGGASYEGRVELRLGPVPGREELKLSFAGRIGVTKGSKAARA